MHITLGWDKHDFLGEGGLLGRIVMIDCLNFTVK